MTRTNEDYGLPMRSERAPKRGFWSIFWLIAKIVGISFAALVFLAVVAFYAYVGPIDKAVAKIGAKRQQLSSTVEDRNGTFIGYLGEQKRIPIRYEDIPKITIKAVLAAEDKRFFEDSWFRSTFGADFRATARTAWDCLKAGRIVGGGSTIPQQIAKNRYLTSEKSVVRKIKETRVAKKLIATYTKPQLMLMYFDAVHCGFNRYGLETCSRFYFGHPASELNLAESATLVGINPNPSRYSPFKNPGKAKMKRDAVLKQMLKEGMITKSEHDAAAGSELKLAKHRIEKQEAILGQEALDIVNAWVKTIVPEAEIPYLGWKIRLTIDLKMQSEAVKRLHDMAVALAKMKGSSEYPDGALILMNAQREILAMVGGSDYKAGGWNNALKSYRQPGSVFKGFSYTAETEAGFLDPETLLSNQEVTFSSRMSAPWTPHNYRGEASKDPVFTARNAFAHSLNIPAANAICGIKVGTEIAEPSLEACRSQGYVRQTIELSENLGIRWTEKEKREMNPSIVLGTKDATLEQLTLGYMGIMLDGDYVESSLIASIEGPNAPAVPKPTVRRGVVSQATVSKMRVMGGAVMTEGTGKAARNDLPDKMYGKSGTTDNSTNAWFIAGTDRLFAGVWFGYKSQNVSLGRDATGAGAALPVLRQVMAFAYGQNPPELKLRLPERPKAEPHAEPEEGEEAEGSGESQNQPLPEAVPAQNREPAPAQQEQQQGNEGSEQGTGDETAQPPSDDQVPPEDYEQGL